MTELDTGGLGALGGRLGSEACWGGATGGISDIFRRKGIILIRLLDEGVTVSSSSWECVVCETDSHRDALSSSDAALVLDVALVVPFDFLSLNKPKSGISKTTRTRSA